MYRIIILAFIGFLSFSLTAQQQLNMSLLGHWDDPSLPAAGSIKYNDIWGYADCEGNEYAILGSAKYILFIDVTDPANPVEIARFPGSVNSVWRDFKTYGQYAYAVADQGTDGLLVFDLSLLPDSVSLVYQDNGNFTRSHNVFIDEPAGRLYLAGSNAISNGVAAYSLAGNPGEPAFLGTQPLPGGYIHDIYVRNHIAYCSHGGNGLWVYDFTDFGNIIALGNLTSYPEQGYNHSSWLNGAGNQLVFADETHGSSLKLADVADLNDITILDLFRSELLAPAATNSIAHNPFIRDQYVIVSYYHEGVQVFDLSNLQEVERVAYYDTYPENQDYSGYQGCWGVYPFLPSGNIIASDITHGLFVLSADSITFEAAEPLEAAIEILSGASPCEGDTVSLQAGQAGLSSYEWLLDGVFLASGPELEATLPGTYQLVVSHAGCSKSSEPLELAFTPLPEAVLGESPFIYCGEAPPVIATPSPGDTYAWFLNGEVINDEHGPELGIAEGGIYQVEVSLNGCRNLSGELEVILGQMPSPLISITLPDTYCAGTDVIDIGAAGSGNQYYTITETNSATTDTFINSYTITTSGSYYIEAFTEHCSMALGPPLEFFFNEPVIPTLTVEENTLASSQAAAYQWYKDGAVEPGATGPSYTAEESGLYFVETVDANGCSARSEAVLLEIISGINVLEGKGLRLYPNPAGDYLYLDAATPPRAVRILSSKGQEVAGWRQWAPGQRAIEIGNLHKGIYLAQLLFEEGIVSLRVFKL